MFAARYQNARYGSHFGRRRVEKNPTEHIHKVVQRTSKMCEQVHLQLRNRFSRRPKTHRLTSSPLAQEDKPLQQETFVQATEDGEHLNCAQVY